MEMFAQNQLPRCRPTKKKSKRGLRRASMSLCGLAQSQTSCTRRSSRRSAGHTIRYRAFVIIPWLLCRCHRVSQCPRTCTCACACTPEGYRLKEGVGRLQILVERQVWPSPIAPSFQVRVPAWALHPPLPRRPRPLLPLANHLSCTSLYSTSEEEAHPSSELSQNPSRAQTTEVPEHRREPDCGCGWRGGRSCSSTFNSYGIAFLSPPVLSSAVSAVERERERRYPVPQSIATPPSTSRSGSQAARQPAPGHLLEARLYYCSVL